MRLALIAGVVVAVAFSTPALANPKAVFFSLSRKSPQVRGAMVVDGYSPKEVANIIRQYCKGGKVGALTYSGKPRKKRKMVLQKFVTTCAGGPHDRFKGSSSSYEVELITKGEYANKHLVEITTSDGAGNMVYLRETIRP